MPNLTFADVTTGVQTVSAAGAVTPTTGLDISGIAGDATIKVRVTALTAAKKARIQLEDSVNAFTAVIPVAVADVKGEIVNTREVVYSFRKHMIPSCRFGTGSAVLRVNVTQIDGSASLSLHAWVEY